MGATFPYPLYARWFNQFASQTGHRIRYLANGSDAGIRALLDSSADFGASDLPVSAIRTDAGRHFLWIPSVIGAVAVTYNLPGLPRPLRLSGQVIADVYRGRVRRWNHPLLRQLNPGIPLPDLPITVVYRADGSGTAAVFREYLRTFDPQSVGRDRTTSSQAFPVGVAESGNEGVAGRVKQSLGAIGFVEVVYARQNRLPVASLRNRHGNYVSPSPFEIAAAAADRSVRVEPDGPTPASLVDAEGEFAYPMAAYSWIVLEPVRLPPERLTALIDLLRWALTDGSDIVSSMGYVPLPSVTASQVLDALDRIVAGDPRRSR